MSHDCEPKLANGRSGLVTASASDEAYAKHSVVIMPVASKSVSRECKTYESKLVWFSGKQLVA